MRPASVRAQADGAPLLPQRVAPKLSLARPSDAPPPRPWLTAPPPPPPPPSAPVTYAPSPRANPWLGVSSVPTRTPVVAPRQEEQLRDAAVDHVEPLEFMESDDTLSTKSMTGGRRDDSKRVLTATPMTVVKRQSSVRVADAPYRDPSVNDRQMPANSTPSITASKLAIARAARIMASTTRALYHEKSDIVAPLPTVASVSTSSASRTTKTTAVPATAKTTAVPATAKTTAVPATAKTTASIKMSEPIPVPVPASLVLRPPLLPSLDPAANPRSAIGPPLMPVKSTEQKFESRDPSFSFKAVEAKYAHLKNRTFLNPRPHEVIPKLHSRPATYAKYEHDSKILFYLTHIETIVQDIFAFGQLRNGASIALRLTNFHPFFYIDVDPAFGEPSENDARRLLELLNQEGNRPERFRTGKKKQPVTNVVLERRVPGVVYSGVVPGTDEREKQWVFRIEFWNMTMLKYYRERLARCEIRGMTWAPTLYHEQDNFTPIQMLFNLNRSREGKALTYCSWVEIDGNECDWVPLDAPDGFGGHSDEEWTSDKLNEIYDRLEQEAIDGSSGGEEDGEEDERLSWKKRQEKWEKLKQKNPKRLTRCIMEGDIDFMKLQARPDIQVGASPLLRCIFDIETASGRVVRWTLDQKQDPPLPDDEPGCSQLDADVRDTLDMYDSLLSRMRERPRIDASEQQRAITSKPKIPRAKQKDKRKWKEIEEDVKQATLPFAALHPRVGGSAVLPIGGGRGRSLGPASAGAAASVQVDPLEAKRAAEEEKRQQTRRRIRELVDAFPHANEKKQQETAHMMDIESQPVVLPLASLAVAEKGEPVVAAVAADEDDPDGHLVGDAIENETRDQVKRHSTRDQQFVSHRHAMSDRDYQAAADLHAKLTRPGTSPSAATANPFDIKGLYVSAPPQVIRAGRNSGSSDEKGPLPPPPPPTQPITGSSARNVDTAKGAANLSPEEYKVLHLFPDPNNPEDPITLISTEFWIHGDPEPFLNVLHGLRTSMPRAELADVVQFRWPEPSLDNERNMLDHWCHMMCSQMDAEWFVTYNGIGYDIPYMAIRGEYLKSKRFPRIGRFLVLPEEAEGYQKRRYEQCRIRAEPKLGRNLKRNNGDYDFPGITVFIPGVLQLDALRVVKGMHKMDTYTLKEVAKALAEDQRKRDLKAVLITPFWCASNFHRSILDYYAKEDSYTTGKVVDVQQMLINVTEQSSLTRTSVHDLMFHGQQKKTWNQLAFVAHHENWLLDDVSRTQVMQHAYGVISDGVPSYLKSQQERADERQRKIGKTRAELSKARLKYTGGFVLKPNPAFLTVPLVPQDFNSLYPSIIIRHNLCWSTWMPHKYDEQGRLYFQEYGDSYETQDASRFVLWRLSEPQPDPKVVGDRDVILVVEDWASKENTKQSEDAARWIAYQQWEKLKPMFPAQPPLVPHPIPPPLPPVKPWVPPEGTLVPAATFCFVVNRKSIFPPILRGLLTQRSAVKKLMNKAEEEGDKFMASVHNARQLALKLAANAAYGFTGAIDGYFGGVAIGAATCILGRHYILLGNLTSEREYWQPSVYGDTDSFFPRSPFLERLPAGGKWGPCLDAKRHISRILQRIRGSTIADDRKLPDIPEEKWGMTMPEVEEAMKRLKAELKLLPPLPKNPIHATSAPVASTSLPTQRTSNMDMKHAQPRPLTDTSTVTAPAPASAHAPAPAAAAAGLLPFRRLPTSAPAVSSVSVPGVVVGQMQKSNLVRPPSLSTPPVDTTRPSSKSTGPLSQDCRATSPHVAYNFALTRLEIEQVIIASRTPTKKTPKPKPIPDLESLDLWIVCGAKVQADACSITISDRCMGAPMKIEPEKVIIRCALYGKKMYAWRQLLPKPKIETRGLGNIRRNYPKVVRGIHQKSLELMLNIALSKIRPMWDKSRRYSKEEIDTAKLLLLAPLGEGLAHFVSGKLSYEDIVVTAAKGENYANDRSMAIQAIIKSEQRKETKYDIGQRVGFGVMLPNPLPKVKHFGKQKLKYDLTALYAYAEEISYAEEKRLHIHRMYYVQGMLKKKIIHALGLPGLHISESDIDRYCLPYVSQIYREDFGLQDLTRFGVSVTKAPKAPVAEKRTLLTTNVIPIPSAKAALIATEQADSAQPMDISLRAEEARLQEWDSLLVAGIDKIHLQGDVDDENYLSDSDQDEANDDGCENDEYD